MSDDLRYPIGRPDLRSPLNADERARKIDRLAAFPARLRAVVEPLSAAQLDTPYREGGWTVRQVIHHLPDSHMNGYIRFKIGATEHLPRIREYREELWAELPEAKTGDIELSLPMLEGLHRRWASFLEALDVEVWSRNIVYSDGREMSLDALLCIYSWHGDHHLAHITGVAEREGWWGSWAASGG